MCSWKFLKKLITSSFTKFQENCQKAREKPSSLVFYPHWIPTRHQKPPPLRRAPPILQLPEPLNSQITTHLKIRKQILKGSNHSFLNIILLRKLKTINLNFGHMIPPSSKARPKPNPPWPKGPPTFPPRPTNPWAKQMANTNIKQGEEKALGLGWSGFSL